MPTHPAVDWTTLRRSEETGLSIVDVRCLLCGLVRPTSAGTVTHRVKLGAYTGFCPRDRNLGRRLVERPDHPAVRWSGPVVRKPSGQRETRAWVTCPDCREERDLNRKWVAYQIEAGRFNPTCQPCRSKSKRSYIDGGRRLSATGYIRVNRSGVAPEDLAFFDAMKRGSKAVPEHRMVMARMLGRPLTSNELVDHMDGSKTHNVPSNLRLYRRGKNDPGSHNGNGTFYHEWQVAEARCRELESQLAR